MEEQEDFKKEKGLGDKVEEIIEKIIPNISKKMKARGCGCKKRKEWLNRNFNAKFK